MKNAREKKKKEDRDEGRKKEGNWKKKN
jgi:hypothetical protein